MRSALPLAFLLILISPHDAVAQRSSFRTTGPVSSRLSMDSDPEWIMSRSLTLDSVPGDIRPTHWKEGGLIGGLSLGVGVALLADALCRSSDSGGSCGGVTIGGFLGGAVIGGVVGALIGGQFPKGAEP